MVWFGVVWCVRARPPPPPPPPKCTPRLRHDQVHGRLQLLRQARLRGSCGVAPPGRLTHLSGECMVDTVCESQVQGWVGGWGKDR